jgi:DNA-binding Lrp family transcriptional regulator
MKLDKKNCQILNILQKDCRASLTEISSEVGLSIDSTRKRIQKMIDNNIFFPKIQLRPRNFGFNNVVDIKIKMQNYEKEDIDNFVKYLKEHENVVEIFSISGEFDFSIVVIAKDAYHLGDITDEIKTKYGKLISEWSESLTTKAYKFEEYDMIKLMKHE